VTFGRVLLRRLKRFAALSAAERALLRSALLVVVMARVALWILPLRVVRRAVARAASAAPEAPVDETVWAVKLTSDYVPRATCLTQALAVQALLSRSGYASRVEIGVAKEGAQAFEAHAWVMIGDQIVIGGPTVDHYSRLYGWELEK